MLLLLTILSETIYQLLKKSLIVMRTKDYLIFQSSFIYTAFISIDQTLLDVKEYACFEKKIFWNNIDYTDFIIQQIYWHLITKHEIIGITFKQMSIAVIINGKTKFAKKICNEMPCRRT